MQMPRWFSLFMLLFWVVSSESLTVESPIVSPCARCAFATGAMWCPYDMTCHTTGPCLCAEPCLSFTDCFTQETDCSGCVSSGGVYCVNQSAPEGRRCFLPNAAPESLSGDGEHCLEDIRDCPAPQDNVLLGWFVTMSVLAVGFAMLSGMVICRGLKGKYMDEQPPQQTTSMRD